MAEEENYEDANISDIIEDSEQYMDSEVTDLDNNQNTEATDSGNINTIDTTELMNTEHILDDKRVYKPEVIRTTRLPMARIKNIIKMDPDVSVVSGEAVFLVTKATVSLFRTKYHKVAPLNVILMN